MRLFLILVMAVVCFPLVGNAQKSILKRNYDKEGKLRIEIESVFDGALTHGFMPVRVTLRNGAAQVRNWTVRFSFGGGWNSIAYNSSFDLKGAGGGETVHDILVPVPTDIDGSSSYRQTSVDVTSPGLPRERASDSQSYTARWPQIGLSAGIADRNASALDKVVSGGSGRGADAFGLPYDPAMLPSDWRGYTGLDVLIITEGEWKTVSPGAKRSILEWIRLGGKLYLFTTQEPVAFLKQSEFGASEIRGKAKKVARGQGSIHAWKWDGKTVDPKGMVSAFGKIKNQSERLSSGFKSWGLQAEFGGKSFNPFLVILLLIAFGVVVGPINLFVLAKPGQRHRLFITTPIISLVACVLIIVLILFKDGVGGKGLRMVVANLQANADEKRLFVTQEQISRAGVLLGTAFETAEAVFLSPVMLPPSEWNRLRLSRSTIAEYDLYGRTYRGDWFQSRSEQGHFLQSVQPTRSRIELLRPAAEEAQPPLLFSSLDFVVNDLFYRDKKGGVWKSKASSISGGAEIELEESTEKELEEWWREQINPLSEPTSTQVKNQIKNKGQFFANSEDQKAGFIDTLDAMRWGKDRAIVFGPAVPAVSTASPNEKPSE